MANETILLVEDETDLLLNNKEYLEKQGYGIMTAERLKDASAALEAARVDLILLDVNLPDGSGLDYIRELRKTSDVPVIFLTCRTDKEDMLDGLKSGGCDYITKPFDLDVLGARIEAQLRSALPRAGAVITRGALSLDTGSHTLKVNGVDTPLSQREFTLLLHFVRNEGRVMRAEELYGAAWGQPMANDANAVRAAVSRLRRKIRPAGYDIADGRGGSGYCFGEPAQPLSAE